MYATENPCKIVCFGDSITKSYCKPFKDKIGARYSNFKIEVVNAGVKSETTRDALSRLDNVLSENANVAVIGFGMNDWRKGVEIDEFKTNLSKIITEFTKRNVRTIVLTITPDANKEGEVSTKLLAYNTALKQVAYECKVRIADAFSLWQKELPNINTGLYDEIHPNRLGNEVICKALMRVVPRTHSVAVWGFNGLYPFCNYQCQYCYVAHDVNKDHHLRNDLTPEKWHEAFKEAFGNERIVFYFSFGEPTLGKGFYEMLEMVASEPQWRGHMTSNLSASLDKLINTKLAKERRFFINASFHPTQTSPEEFLKKLQLLRANGIECPVIIVAWPPTLAKLAYYVEFFSSQGFVVHIRRFRGWFDGLYYPASYTDEQRRLVAKYCDDATIKYMLNESSVNMKGKLSYEGMYYVLVDENGDVWTSPDSKGQYHGNVFKKDVRLFTEPQPYPVSWCGSVNGIANLLETDYEELEGNFVLNFSKQGGVFKDEAGIVKYRNLETDFTDPKIRNMFGFPDTNYSPSATSKLARKLRRKFNSLTEEYLSRKVYPFVERQRRSIIKRAAKLLGYGKVKSKS